QAEANGLGLEHIDITPKDALIELIRKHYPIQMYESEMEGGQEVWNPVSNNEYDENGEPVMETYVDPATGKEKIRNKQIPVLDPVAIEMRDELLLKIAD